MSPASPEKDITDPKFDTINNRFGQYDLFGSSDGGETSLFRSRYNSLEQELANTPYAFATERTLRLSDPVLDITIDSQIDVHNELFGPKTEPAFTVTQLIHAQDRFFDLSARPSGRVRTVVDGFEVKSAPGSGKRDSFSDGAFKVIPTESARKLDTAPSRGFREETSRHNTPKTSTANSRAGSPRRTSSLTRVDKMAQAATLFPLPLPNRPPSPKNFLKENMKEVRELSEINREKHEAEAEEKRKEEEAALLKEMGLLDNKIDIKNSRNNSRTTSPNKLTFRSRSNSPAAILHYENTPKDKDSAVVIKNETGNRSVHRSRARPIAKSQPESKNVSPKHSKIPQRQTSVSPPRNGLKKQTVNGLGKNHRYISNSTSSIHETIRIGSQTHDKRSSQSIQHLAVAPSGVKSKPPISPGKNGPPPSNKSINAKRLSPIVGTPNKSPIEDLKPNSAKTSPKPLPIPKKPIKTAGNTPTTSKLNLIENSRNNSRDPSPEKKVANKNNSRPNSNAKPPIRTASTKAVQKTTAASKTEAKKPVSRTNSVKNLSRSSSTKTLNEKQPLKKTNSKKDLAEKEKPATSKTDVIEKSDKVKEEEKARNVEDISDSIQHHEVKKDHKDEEAVSTQDNETQCEKMPNENGDLVLLTKKNVVSMTTAAITSQPLEVVTTVTNQLPAAFEKAREKGIFERLNSKDSLIGKDDDKESHEQKIQGKEEKRPPRPKTDKTIFSEDNIKLKLLQPPYNNPQVERVKQKIDDILKEPEISTENILSTMSKVKDTRDQFKKTAEKSNTDAKETKAEVESKLTEIKNQTIKKEAENVSEIRAEAKHIVDSIITPVEEPKDKINGVKDIKGNIEPTVTVVKEKKDRPDIEKINEAMVKGEPEVEVQSSNVSTPGEKATLEVKKTDDDCDKSAHSNGGFPQSTSTTPKVPARTNKQKQKPETETETETETEHQDKKQNICLRLMGKCANKCCPCCSKANDEGETETQDLEKKTLWSRLNCVKKKVSDEDLELAAGKLATIEFESETKRKRKLRDVLCSCCRRKRVSDISEPISPVGVSPPVASTDIVTETGCCGKKKEAERRDSILSDKTPPTCCNNRLGRWMRGACRRQTEPPSSRRTSLFSKNKSLSPTLPPEDTRTKLDASLVEHTSVMR
ncbi:unnamed protein product, partial [Leptidea sinapis]